MAFVKPLRRQARPFPMLRTAPSSSASLWAVVRSFRVHAATASKSSAVAMPSVAFADICTWVVLGDISPTFPPSGIAKKTYASSFAILLYLGGFVVRC